MNGKLAITILAVLTAASLSAKSAKADTVSDFYSGKTVTVYVPVDAGGLYSNYAQMMVPHFSRHIPGNPTVIVKHQPGAGGLAAMNFVYNAAAKDGLSLVTPLAGLSKRVVQGEKNAKYDPSKLNWLGGWGESLTVCSVLKARAPSTVEEAKKKEIILGSIGKSNLTYTYPTLMNNMIGTKFKIISGYGGGSPIRLAMEKGEVDGWCGNYFAWKQTKPEWVAEGKLAHLVQFASKRYREMPNVPILSDLARNEEERQIYSYVQGGLDDFALAAPPDVPADRLAALEKAYIDTLSDPKFLADAKKLKLDIDVVTAKEIREFVKNLMSVKPETIAKINKAMEQN